MGLAVTPIAVVLIGVHVQVTDAQQDRDQCIINLVFVAARAGFCAPTLVLTWNLPDDDPEDLAGA